MQQDLKVKLGTEFIANIFLLHRFGWSGPAGDPTIYWSMKLSADQQQWMQDRNINYTLAFVITNAGDEDQADAYVGFDNIQDFLLYKLTWA